MGNTNEQLPETLYYYCSLDTFFNIIKDQTIWLTEIGKSNDSFEQKYLATELINNLEKFVDMVGDKSITDTEICELKNIYKNKVKLLQPIPVWAMCFSEKGDDLSQWRGYGDDGKGICIGFNFDYLNVINCLTDTPNFDFMRFRKIEYGQEAIDNYFKYLEEDRKLRNLNKCKIKERLDKIIYRLLSVPYYKPDVFEVEQEWRMVYSYGSLIEDYVFDFDELNKTRPFSKNFEILGNDYLVHNEYLKSYIKIKIKNMLDCIDIIYIGPKSKLTKSDIQRFLIDKINFDKSFEIENSKANSYR